MKLAIVGVLAAMTLASPSFRKLAEKNYPLDIHADCLVDQERRLLDQTGVPYLHLDCAKRRVLLESARAQANMIDFTALYEAPALLSHGQGIGEEASLDEPFLA
ncbi:hypothetical protein AC1031_017394 [Aphanomyces cochlioides]|nr:hypothetical protein AC1031_017392 [Aphanomyces cochlioides]KAG9411759.1 hypothetical protein AC1031_017393 [Aphanomyces cochlioides]KAG9411760.1 hypothetical protein AC1031_017394 [Aphanomyces cochlioides]